MELAFEMRAGLLLASLLVAMVAGDSAPPPQVPGVFAALDAMRGRPPLSTQEIQDALSGM